MPVNARRRYRRLLDLQPSLRSAVEELPFHHLTLAGKRGIVCSGTGYNYVREALHGTEDSLLRIAAYPLPEGLLRKLVDHCDEVFVFEDGYPFIECHLTGLYGVPGKAVHGRLDGTLREDGELLPDTVARALGLAADAGTPPNDALVVGRPPQFCKGCPHAFTFDALVDATAGYERPLLFSDIGCYAMGIMPPYSAVHSVVDMGASIGMAHGASRGGAFPVICTIGDSTFAHSGLPALLGAVHFDANITVLILDNATTAMTGSQDSFATGEELVEMLKGLGVKDLHVFEPLPKHRVDNVETIKKAIEHRGLSVIVSRRACIHYKKPKLTGLPVCQST